MGKKKQNPNRVPVSLPEDYMETVKTEETNRMVMRAWALIMAALSSFQETTADSMEQLWHDVNRYPTKIHSYQDAVACLKALEKKTGVHIDCVQIGIIQIKTQGDLIRFHRRLDRYAIGLSWAILFEPMVEKEFFPDEMLRKILEKALSFNEEMEEGRISLEDIQGMLKDEYGVNLESENQVVCFSRV